MRPNRHMAVSGLADTGMRRELAIEAGLSYTCRHMKEMREHHAGRRPDTGPSPALLAIALLLAAIAFASCSSTGPSLAKGVVTAGSTAGSASGSASSSVPGTKPGTGASYSSVATAAATAALAPDIPELARIFSSPSAASLTPSERATIEQTLARYTSLESPAPQYRSDKPDPRTSRVTASLLSAAAKDPVRNLPALTQALIAGEKDPFLRIKLIHDWIAETITYDVSMLTRSTVTGQDLATVLSTKRAVCSGYARLFETMARQAGFEVKTIEGYARGLGSAFAFDQRNSHAWNMVRIGDLWYLVDVTFDAGAFQNGTYQKRYRIDYLFPPPVQLRYTHFPEHPAWQLFPVPLDRSGFLSRAMVQSAFFRYGLKIPSAGAVSGVPVSSGAFFPSGIPDLPAVQKAAGMCTLEIEAPEGVILDGSVFDSKGREIDASVLANRLSATRWKLMFATPAAGTYTATVFAGRSGSGASAAAPITPTAPTAAAQSSASTRLESVMQFGIENTKAWPSSPLLPKVYGRYHNLPGELLESPLAGSLVSGETVRFVYRSSARHVAIIYDQNFVPLNKTQQGLFVLDFKVPRTSTVKLGVSENGADYQIVLAWVVR